MRRLYTRQKRSIEHFGPMLCSSFFSYSIRSSIAIRPIGPQVTANRFDQRSASPQFKQPSSTSTVSLSTASLSTSSTKSKRGKNMSCSIGSIPWAETQEQSWRYSSAGFLSTHNSCWSNRTPAVKFLRSLWIRSMTGDSIAWTRSPATTETRQSH